MTGKPVKYPVSERALIQRLNRKLAQDHLRVKKTREGRAMAFLGDYYVLDIYRNVITEHHLSLADLVEMAKEHSVMAGHEKLEEEQ